MTKRARSILFVLSAVIVVIVAGIIAVSLFAEGAVREAIQNAGAKAFQTAVTIEKTKLSLLGGSLNLEGLTIDNPSGYQHKTFLELKRGDMRVKTTSLLGDGITIRDLTLDGLDAVVEQNGTGSNLQDIIHSLHQAPPFGKRLYIAHLEITNITVYVALPSLAGQTGLIPMKLSPIRMTDLGRDEQLDATKLAHKILTALAADIAEQSGQFLPKQVADGLGGVLDTALGIGKTLLGTGSQNGTEAPKESTQSKEHP